MRLLVELIAPTSKILVLAPHPDDFDAVAVSMRLLKNDGCDIKVYILTSGSSGVEDSFCPEDTSPEHKRSIRQQEQRAACSFFGLCDKCISFAETEEDSDSHLLMNNHNRLFIGDLIAREFPDFIFLPHGHDTNRDHQITYHLTTLALKTLKTESRVCLIYDPKTIDADVNAITAFDEAEAGWKAEMLRHHASQHQRNLNTRGYGFDKRILSVNRRLARELNIETGYAEGFEVRNIK